MAIYCCLCCIRIFLQTEMKLKKLFGIALDKRKHLTVTYGIIVLKIVIWRGNSSFFMV